MRTLIPISFLLPGSGPAAAQSPLPAEITFLTAPRRPVAGEPWTIVVKVSSAGADRVPDFLPEARRVGDEIHVFPNLECDAIFCDAIFCDVIEPAVGRAPVPALDGGVYTVRVQENGQLRMLTTVEVAEAPARTARRRVDGFWSAPGKPGSGRVLQLRDGTLGIGVFEFPTSPQRGFWILDTPPLHGATAAATLRAARPLGATAHCLTCANETPASLALSHYPLRLEFESDRRVWIDQGGERSALVATAFGADDVGPLRERIDADFAPLPLPDMSGRWLLDAPGASRVVEFGAVQAPAQGYDFGGEVTRSRREAGATRRAGCRLRADSASFEGAFARIGDITPQRMRFSLEPRRGGSAEFDAVRID